jgi:enamine deaminase RidA (YjgF/YER057c/UK114 family)
MRRETATGSGVRVETRTRRAGKAAELHVCVRPLAPAAAERQAEAAMAAVAGILAEHGAAILQERVFASNAGIEAVRQARCRHLAPFDDGVEPAWLRTPANGCGEISGVTVHAVAGCGRPDVLPAGGCPAGRRLQVGSSSLVTVSGLRAAGADAPAQARAMLLRAEALLTGAGGGLRDVVRTWMWLGDILSWYGEFNRVRSGLFRERGLLEADGDGVLPASTGIGIGPEGGGFCAMDLVAGIGAARPRFLLRAGRQGAASCYGSAFSRAAVVDSPFGRKVYVSGTAAIDAAGQTTHADDPAGQIEDTLQAVEAALREAGCGMDDVVEAVVYCRTPQVERLFRRRAESLRLPHVLAIADICRDNLHFEIECTAIRPP